MNNGKYKTNSAFLNGQINVNNKNKIQSIKNISSPKVKKSSHINTGDINYGNITHQEIVTDNSKTYKIDKEDTQFIESLSVWLLNKYDEKKLKVSGIISAILGAITTFDAFFSSLPTFSWLPRFHDSNGIVLILGISLVFVGSFLLKIVNYKYESRCDNCEKPYALAEIEDPEVKEIEAHDGIRQTITRTYKCRECGHIQIKKANEFIEKEYSPV
jgi:hypothetical protein